MNSSRKQEIYREMLSRALPHIRNVQTQGFWRKAMDRSCYEEAELVHNLYQTIFIPEFVDHDIYFLNTQARNYVNNGRQAGCWNYSTQVMFIRELFDLVPEHLRVKLTWAGPAITD